MTFMKNFTTLTTLSFIITLQITSFAKAAPVVTRDVYVPPILKPMEHDIWQIGQNTTVSWNTTSPTPPINITNPSGKIMLRKGGRTLLNIILADNFDILSGTVNFTVPDVDPGDDYRVVLYGDSGNWSPTFTIKASP
ncbi:hypothetical protein BDZ94DRAFT_1255152 [Collybia nuda]|uniref:Yeast cell wall synthesis Kre9/Knh1-like N-terminal domain-containing protein n=1 Tax=Collybia nuda TaxID=64659 RepID=A0A9P5Y9A4_9AGAR|nr:hypothetical protein BDZ94DRAFT_1255152 [Collybia nuda]